MIRILYKIYHSFPQSPLRACRYDPTCSQYMLEAIDKYGLIKGFAKGILRILSCHPLSKRPYFDPV